MPATYLPLTSSRRSSESYIVFSGSAEDYFESIFRLPSPLRELYAVLILDSTIGFDGLACAIPRYHHPVFEQDVRSGFRLLGEDRLLALYEQAREHLLSDATLANRSNTPNVTFAHELPEVNKSYFEERKRLMPAIGQYLKVNAEAILAAGNQLNEPN
jgi:hypothetical protein